MRIPSNVVNNFSRPNIDNAVFRVNNSNNRGTKKIEKHDEANVTPMGKLAKQIEKLIIQKQEVIERKNEYLMVATEKKYTFDMIKDRVKMYDEQIRGIENKLADAFKQATKLEEENSDSKKTEKDIVDPNIETQDKIQKVLKERGFQPVNDGLFSGIIKAEAKMEIATKERGAIQRAEVKLDTEKALIRPDAKQLNKLEAAVDRSINVMLSTAVTVNEEVNETQSNKATKEHTVKDASKPKDEASVELSAEKMVSDEVKIEESKKQEN